MKWNGHFNSCLTIAHIPSSPDMQDYLSNTYTVHIMHVFALIDALGKEHSFLKEV